MKKINKFKKGAASYYIVAFSTLILVVIATSFAMVIISEISRSANDDLSQSAYDSALAGVEDAKVAFSNYRRCKEAQLKNSNIGSVELPLSGNPVRTCGNIIAVMENIPDEYKCYAVAYILGKKNYGQKEEVTVGGEEVTTGGEMTSSTNQAYTCVQINTELKDYRATLSANNTRQTFKASTSEGASNVKKIRFSWYTMRADARGYLNYNNFKNTGTELSPSYKVSFAPINSTNSIPTPPTVEFQIVQTGPVFTMADFDSPSTEQTNRATLYLVPTSVTNDPHASGSYNWIGSGSISARSVASTNSKTVSNKPFVITCGDYNTTTEFYCSTEIELPNPVGGEGRNNDTFMISVALPYQTPDTDFSVELCNSNDCWSASATGGGTGGSLATINNTQISIDSTGRANDLYRRVETRMETTDTTFGFNSPYYALEILGSGNTTKNLTVTYEPTPEEGGFYF